MVTLIPLPDVEEPKELAQNYILYWHACALDLNRLTHSVDGPQTGPPLSARSLGMVQLAVHDVYFAINPSERFFIFPTPFSTFLTPGNNDPLYRLPDATGASSSRDAVAGAAITMLSKLYTQMSDSIALASTMQLKKLLEKYITDFGALDTNGQSYQFGVEVANVIYNLLFHADGVASHDYKPTPGPYKFNDEPTHPVRLVPVDPNDPNGPKKAIRIYHGPFYGSTAKRFATQTEHVIADPPGIRSAALQTGEYDDAIRDIIRMGGAPGLNSTKRSPSQTVRGHFWAYDGSNLIGTPPRLYNQIMRVVAVKYRVDKDNIGADINNADFARLLALVNVALADAGVFSWKEKWEFEFWRPLTGVRDDDMRDGRLDRGDPFWLSLGAPSTNTNDIPFKPPFPAYPSGHATFGGAAFQIARRYYNGRDGVGSWDNNGPDTISFEMISEEINGISRDLRQPYDPKQPITEQPGIVRTRVPRKFESLWEAIFENALSRIFLGVHWRFDAAAAKDILIPTETTDTYAVDQNGGTVYQGVKDIRYETKGTRADMEGLFPIGGVPLGIEIADQIFDTGLKPTPPSAQPAPMPLQTQQPVNGLNGVNDVNGLNGADAILDMKKAAVDAKEMVAQVHEVTVEDGSE